MGVETTHQDGCFESIPMDWQTKTLGEIGYFSKGKGISRGDITEVGPKCIRYGEIYTKYNNHTKKPISHIPIHLTGEALPVKKGDLLFAGSGETAEEIGKCIVYLGEETVYAGGDIVVWRPSKPAEQDSLYLAYLMNYDIVSKQKASFGQGDAVVHISAFNLARLKFPLPSRFQEQNVVSLALYEVDSLITSLGNLIDKKQKIKQGTMQQLLKGKKRLPGFIEPWATKTIGEIATLLKGSGLSKEAIDTSGNNKCILYGQLFTTYNQVIDNVVSRTNAIQGIRSKSGDVLMPGSTTTVGIDLATASALLSDNILLGGDIIIIRNKNEETYDPIFLAYYLTHTRKNGIAQLAQGITIIHLYGSSLANLEIIVPSTLSEQVAIAKVLTDMDSEIEALEHKLSKYQLIKQGMMQELLTGRKRLL
jgi:type I restriction enzyme S subunit